MNKGRLLESGAEQWNGKNWGGHARTRSIDFGDFEATDSPSVRFSSAAIELTQSNLGNSVCLQELTAR
jgi:hypothetical protein